VCISRQRNSGYKAEQVKYRGTRPLKFPPPFPPLALIHTSFSKIREAMVHKGGMCHLVKKGKKERTIPHRGRHLLLEIYHQVHALSAVLHVTVYVRLLLLYVQDPAHHIHTTTVFWNSNIKLYHTYIKHYRDNHKDGLLQILTITYTISVKSKQAELLTQRWLITT